MLGFPRTFWELGNCCKICSRPRKLVYWSLWHTNLREARQLLPYKRCLLLTTLSADDEGAMKVVNAFIHSSYKRWGTWMMQSFPLKFTDHLKRSNADRYHQSSIVFDFNTVCMCLTGSITVQCGLSGGKQKLIVILLYRSIMQVTKGTCCMREQCVPGSLSSSPA